MNRDRMVRFAAVLVGAGVIFGLEQQLGAQWYVAIPTGIVVYIATLVALGFLLGSSNQTK
jgi:hypothetical protein